MPLTLQLPSVAPILGNGALCAELKEFSEFGRATLQQTSITESGIEVPVFINEFWTSKQRAANPLHEVSYRACFKPQVPRFFIERLTQPGDLVYDPFMGRGTTLLEASMLGRRVAGCDINPVGRVLVSPRLDPPSIDEIERRLSIIDFEWDGETWDELLVFYHPDTLRQLTALRYYLHQAKATRTSDHVDEWIQMVATNRLTGHSPGFFSVYTLPPNQAVSISSQRRINERRSQSPQLRDVASLIIRKSRRLLSDSSGWQSRSSTAATILSRSCDDTPEISSGSVDLIVTSPPFLDTINYAQDNWLRAWFCEIDLNRIPILSLRNVDDWTLKMTGVFGELSRVLRDGGHIAFEVGEVRNGKVQLEHYALEAGVAAGLEPVLTLINDQQFTKTANCWGVDNNTKGTNSNRVVVFRK